MYYNNNYNSGYNRYPNRAYNSSPRGSQFPQSAKKKSGAKFGYAKNDPGKPFVRGWRASRRFGLVTYMCGPYKGTHRSSSKSGREWENWVCKMTFQDGRTQLTSCLYDVTTQKVIVKDAGIVINHKAPNGGYCGRFGNKR